MKPTHVRCVESNEQHLTKGKVYRIILTPTKNLVIINTDNDKARAKVMAEDKRKEVKASRRKDK